MVLGVVGFTIMGFGRILSELASSFFAHTGEGSFLEGETVVPFSIFTREGNNALF